LRNKTATAFLCLAIILGTIPVAQGSKKSRYAYRSTYTFENRGEEPYILVEDDTEIPLYFNNKWQTVTILESSHDVLNWLPDEDGNPVGHLDLWIAP
jgi:hypothetical protein